MINFSVQFSDSDWSFFLFSFFFVFLKDPWPLYHKEVSKWDKTFDKKKIKKKVVKYKFQYIRHIIKHTYAHLQTSMYRGQASVSTA